MEILLGEADKRIVRLAIYLLRKKLGDTGTREAMHDDMINCGNPGIRSIAQKTNDVAEKIAENYQRKTVIELTELGLWICYKDTAYRDVFFYLLNEILKDADNIREQIQPYVKQPDEWHVNLWNESKKLTKKQIEKGEIPRSKTSYAESVFVPTVQKKRLSKIANKEIKR